MKLFSICLLTLLFGCESLFSQTVIWSEDFGTDGGGGCTSQGTSAVGFNSGNGAWTETLTGTNDPEANLWFVSTMEEGVGAGNCGDGCGATSPNATNRTLHLSNAAVPLLGLPADQGAAYNAGGGCPSFFCVATDRRIESPNINLSAQANNMTLTFEYIHLGDGTDQAELVYFDGATWQSLGVMPNTTTGACAPQHEWALYTWVMPAGLNIANFRIGWRWFNNDDGAGTDPTIAVDNIQITIPTTGTTDPVASFTPSQTNFCEGDCINLVDNSIDGSAGPITSWTWSVNPAAGAPAITNIQNPSNICWNTAGTYDITLTVDDGTATDDTTITVTVNSCNLPIASFIPSQTTICEGDCIDFTDNSTDGANGPNNSWVWSVTPAGGPAIPAIQNPTNQCFNTAGTYDVTLTVSDGTDSDDTTITITVNNCASTIEASFTPSQTTICENDCITFTDGSTTTDPGGITAWNWTFTGGTPGTGSGQNPGSVCYATAGTYNVTLSVQDGAGGTDDTTIAITVTACAQPVAAITPPSVICEGQCVDFLDASTGGATSWEWSFTGASVNTSTDQNPTNICYPIAGTYDVTLIVSNSNGADTITIQVVVNALPVVNAGPDVTINVGEVTTLVPSGPAGNYVWTPNTGLSCDVCLNPNASPLVTTEYLLTVTDANGCSGWSTVTVFVNVEEGIGVPNAFSPNGDGFNDVLYVKGNGIESMIFSVYNRYGQQVFTSNDQTVGWDGTFNGKKLNPGVFVYVVSYNFFGGERQELKGNVTLVK